MRPGYPKLIRDVWGIEGPIDAAFTRINCQGKTYLFKVPNLGAEGQGSGQLWRAWELVHQGCGGQEGQSQSTVEPAQCSEDKVG